MKSESMSAFDKAAEAPDHDHPQCARCGSSATYTHCPECEDGYEEYDYGDDVVEDLQYRPCSVCNAKGGWYVCLSSVAFCQANPLPGREAALHENQQKSMPCPKGQVLIRNRPKARRRTAVIVVRSEHAARRQSR